MEFKDWLKKNYKKGIKWFNLLPEKKKLKIKTKFDLTYPKPSPVKEENIKLNTGQTFSKNIIDIGGQELFLENSQGQGFRIAYFDEGYSFHNGGQHLIGRTQWKSYINGQPNPFGEEVHGSAVTGLLIGKGEIITGLACEVDLFYSCKVMNDGMGFMDSFANGLEDMLNLPDSLRPDVIGMSIGTILPEGELADDVKRVNSLISQLKSKNVILIASSGNRGIPRWNSNAYSINAQEYPSTLSEVDAIGNIDWGDNINASSSPGDIDFAANGTNVVSFNTNGLGFNVFTGTSFSTPIHMSILVALMSRWVNKEGMNKEQVKRDYKKILVEKKLIKDLMVSGRDLDTGLGQIVLP